MSWHIPNEEEIEFVLEVFRDIVEPTLAMLETSLEDGMPSSPPLRPFPG
jgi:proteasome activator subunit 4